MAIPLKICPLPFKARIITQHNETEGSHNLNCDIPILTCLSFEMDGGENFKHASVLFV